MECQIRQWKLEDAPDLAFALNNECVHQYLRDGLPFPYTVENAKSFIHEMLHTEPHKTYAFAITVEDKAVGSIGVFRKENIHFRTAEIGYFVAQPFWGKGLGTSAVGQVCHYIFAHTDIIRLFAEPFSHNIASCRVFEKNGFLCEGTLRSNAVKQGKVLDMKLYAKIKAGV